MKKELNIEWAPENNGNIIIDGILFEQVGEGFPEEDNFGDVFICHNFESPDGSKAKSWHPVTSMECYDEGDLDCCDWDDWDSATVEIIK